MKVYKLVHNKYKGEIVFGLPQPYNKSLSEIYINNLFKDMKPWKQCIPYYKNSYFTFLSLDALMSFLFNNHKLEEDLFEDFCNKFYIESFEISTWSSGLSKFLCTYFNDEINKDGEKQKYNIGDIMNYTYKIVIQDFIPKYDISLCKEQYYKNVKTFY